MTGQNKLKTIFRLNDAALHCLPGRVMSEFTDQQPGQSNDVLRQALNQGQQQSLRLLDQAGVRGCGGGGFPAAHKWWLVSSAEATEKYFVCNAHSTEPGSGKESWFILANPLKVLEAVAIASYCAGANTAVIALPENAREEIDALQRAIQIAYTSGWLDLRPQDCGWKLTFQIVQLPQAYIAGEETALLEFIEGKPAQPRGKPPLPTSQGLFGKPTAISNLETVLQCRYALRCGPETFRSVGTANSPGTMVFSLHGEVNRPGIYEVPLGISLREFINQYGEGVSSGTRFKAAFPGGISSPVLGHERLDTPLEFDSLRDAGSDLGSGTIIVIGEGACMVELASRLADFFHQQSCGKCLPCKDGTARIHTMLVRIDQLDQSGIDIADRTLAPSRRQTELTVLNNVPRGISYTDTVKGLDKISHLCEFFRYRGDCHHSTESANSLLSLLQVFRDEFDYHMRHGVCPVGKADLAKVESAAVSVG